MVYQKKSNINFLRLFLGKTLLASALIGISFLSTAAEMDHSEKHAKMAVQQQTEMQKELSASMHKMHLGMEQSIHETDADKAFALGMIAHHLGAIDMAKIELKYGTDPEMRHLAEQIIKAQDPEIKQMKQWLAEQSK